jgi:hypothetical protein
VDEDLHTICMRSASLLDPRELPWCGDKGQGPRDGIGGIAVYGMPTGSVCGYGCTNVTRRGDQLVQYGRGSTPAALA